MAIFSFSYSLVVALSLSNNDAYIHMYNGMKICEAHEYNSELLFVFNIAFDAISWRHRCQWNDAAISVATLINTETSDSRIY